MQTGEVIMALNIIFIIIVIWISIYTFSYGVWTWKSKNKFGAFAVMLIALLATVLPFMYLFLR